MSELDELQKEIESVKKFMAETEQLEQTLRTQAEQEAKEAQQAASTEKRQ